MSFPRIAVFEQPGFPSDAARRLAPAEHMPMRELNYRPAQVLRALRGVGLVVEHFDEFPDAFWPQFPRWPASIRGQVPLSYAILARRPEEQHTTSTKDRR